METTTNSISLNDLAVGDIAVVKGFSMDEVPTKFYDLGFTPGSKFKIYKKAPFRGPICIEYGVEGCLLALRSSEALTVLVEKIL